MKSLFISLSRNRKILLKSPELLSNTFANFVMPFPCVGLRHTSDCCAKRKAYIPSTVFSLVHSGAGCNDGCGAGLSTFTNEFSPIPLVVVGEASVRLMVNDRLQAVSAWCKIWTQETPTTDCKVEACKWRFDRPMQRAHVYFSDPALFAIMY